ncbi:DUF192 domain-containing protein [Dinoroseobacter sp. PD6]|uniref:DUF192 domain-containing protein n=1 Tax=Dinoroseobacter sp. PD6 TaxID=3028384 RepID=UPI00237A74D5|nr:DUF192 domain-containing protein [Dinoroseobacter sp. PD6]MDD9715371.1 DUF192 domain-containing protein [Dinoroseobacter sp. PD6]
MIRRMVLRALVLPLVLCLAVLPLHAACAPDRVELEGPWGRAAFDIELADTDETRGRGLMFRESLPQQAGMLFVYDRPQPVSFWMRNTLIPLDMIFADRTGIVRKVHRNAVPLDETPIFGGDEVFAVLEINGGMTLSLGISEGTLMRHPAFDQTTAAWPCAD